MPRKVLTIGHETYDKRGQQKTYPSACPAPTICSHRLLNPNLLEDHPHCHGFILLLKNRHWANVNSSTITNSSTAIAEA